MCKYIYVTVCRPVDRYYGYFNFKDSKPLTFGILIVTKCSTARAYKANKIVQQAKSIKFNGTRHRAPTTVSKEKVAS